ncbi:MAG: GIY-YIG nuclease family protein [Saprospiraceae bacterium]|nr:GIY-YIG nuclease family protein [Saprospiraceae bacterium]
MSFIVYIIHSVKLDKFYIGTTDDFNKRLEEHNHLKYPNSFTAKGIPWSLYLTILCKTSGQAYKLEKYIKSRKSSVFIKKLRSDESLLSNLISKLT